MADTSNSAVPIAWAAGTEADATDDSSAACGGLVLAGTGVSHTGRPPKRHAWHGQR